MRLQHHLLLPLHLRLDHFLRRQQIEEQVVHGTTVAGPNLPVRNEAILGEVRRDHQVLVRNLPGSRNRIVLLHRQHHVGRADVPLVGIDGGRPANPRPCLRARRPRPTWRSSPCARRSARARPRTCRTADRRATAAWCRQPPWSRSPWPTDARPCRSCSDIGAISPGRWQLVQFAKKIGATSLLKVGAAASRRACCGRRTKSPDATSANASIATSQCDLSSSSVLPDLRFTRIIALRCPSRAPAPSP